MTEDVFFFLGGVGKTISDWGIHVQNDTELERVSKKSLKPNDICPICGIAFLDG